MNDTGGLLRAVLVKGGSKTLNRMISRQNGRCLMTIGIDKVFKEFFSREREKWGTARGESMVERFF